MCTHCTYLSTPIYISKSISAYAKLLCHSRVKLSKSSYHHYPYAVDLRFRCVRARSRAEVVAALAAAAVRSAETAMGTALVREPWPVIPEDWNEDTNT